MSDGTDSNDASLPLAALERIEGVCLDFEAAWQKRQQPQIKDYLGAALGNMLRCRDCASLHYHLDRLNISDDVEADAFHVAWVEDVVQEVSSSHLCNRFRSATTGVITTPGFQIG